MFGPDVRFGSKADPCSAATHVRFTPNSDRESRHRQPAMSALPPKADMCSANTDVRYGPEADILKSASRSPQIVCPQRRSRVLSCQQERLAPTSACPLRANSGLRQRSKTDASFNQLIGALLKRHWYV